MVSNLSANKPGWEEKFDDFSNWAEIGQKIQKELLFLVDEDTKSFNQIIDAIRMAKDTESEKKLRIEAIQNASKYAAEVPYQVMQTSYKSLDLLKAMLEIGNPASMSDTGVGALCCLTAIEGAYMNVRINTKDLNDKDFASNLNKKANKLIAEAKLNFGLIIKQVHENIH